MKTIVAFVFILLLNACQSGKEQEPEACQPPLSLIAQSNCESGYQGTYLIASDYKETTGASILFEIFPQKDTLSNDISVKSAWKNGSNQHERILISDTVLGNSPKFLVQISINCSGTELKSKYFAFVKRPAANPACFVWRQVNT
ncbi:hypothetical protein [Larkinella terrae]|uniref:Uncharacterized protein n=1 Tax=Larkinella terrae TaxID=2025311 RepID=A0A7K0EJK9_9BACT|nr:hypothetical protein [Larkinella terrae]MRS61646.1 hypothetical protein [Larkinella terrae]